MLTRELIHMNIYNRTIFFILSLLVIASCEDVIDVDLEDAPTLTVVDAWINNLPEDQKIVLTQSQSYFENSTPTGIVDAAVVLKRNDGMEFTFIHESGGTYVWESNGETLGSVGDILEMEIQNGTDVINAASEIYRVPDIDSIGVEFRENEIFTDDGLYVQFYARDFADKGDTYWIKTYYNGEYLKKTQELNIAFDAGFDAGTGIDGLVFIPPIRELINRLDEDLIPQPVVEGDHVRVEIHSISNAGFNFLEIARDQINNGDNGIFSIPLANTRSNITSQSGDQVLGFFNVAAVSMNERTIE